MNFEEWCKLNNHLDYLKEWDYSANSPILPSTLSYSANDPLSAMNKAENAERQRRAEEQRRIQAQKRAEEERRRQMQMRQQQQSASSNTYTLQAQHQPPKRKTFWQRLKDFFSGN